MSLLRPFPQITRPKRPRHGPQTRRLTSGRLARTGDVWGIFIVGLVMIWASRLLLAVVVFWAPQVELDVLSSALWQCGRYPVQIYRQPIRFALTYILPLAYIATMPAYVLTHGQNFLPRCLVGLLLAGGWWAACGGFGKRGCGVIAVPRVRGNQSCRCVVVGSRSPDHSTLRPRNAFHFLWIQP
jgi:hypothetical protein